jgi:hypothetical protein
VKFSILCRAGEMVSISVVNVSVTSLSYNHMSEASLDA